MKITVAEFPFYHLVSVTGKITIGLGDIQLRHFLAEMVANGARKIILDLSKVSYIDSSGLGELIHIYKGIRQQNVDMCLVGLNAKLYRTLDLAQLISLFPIFDSVEDAAMMNVSAA